MVLITSPSHPHLETSYRFLPSRLLIPYCFLRFPSPSIISYRYISLLLTTKDIHKPMHPICEVPDSKIQYSIGTMFPSYLRLSGCSDSSLLVPTCSPWSSRSCCRPCCPTSFSSLRRLYSLYSLKGLYCGSRFIAPFP